MNDAPQIPTKPESHKSRTAMWRELRRGLAVPFMGGFLLSLGCLSISGLGVLMIIGISLLIGIMCAILALAAGGA